MSLFIFMVSDEKWEVYTLATLICFMITLISLTFNAFLYFGIALILTGIIFVFLAKKLDSDFIGIFGIVFIFFGVFYLFLEYTSQKWLKEDVLSFLKKLSNELKNEFG